MIFVEDVVRGEIISKLCRYDTFKSLREYRLNSDGSSDGFLIIGVIIAHLKDLGTIPVVRECAKMGNSLFAN